MVHIRDGLNLDDVLRAQMPDAVIRDLSSMGAGSNEVIAG